MPRSRSTAIQSERTAAARLDLARQLDRGAKQPLLGGGWLRLRYDIVRAHS
jgi:hypothetical protein